MEKINLIIILSICIIIFLFLNKIFKNKNKDKDKDEKPIDKKNYDYDLVKNKPDDNNGIIGRKFENKSNENSVKSPISWGQVDSYEKEIRKEINSSNIEYEISKNLEEVEEIKEVEEKIKKNKKLILLVDDSMTILKFTSNILTKNGYDVVTKLNGEEGIEYLESNNIKPDLILSDIEMPKMNGVELIKKIRLDNKYINIPIIIISSHSESHFDLMTEGLINGFLQKPFKEKDLLEQLNYIFSI